MRLLAASLLVSLFLLNTSATAPFEDCSCTAADGSCSASVSCGGGCIAYCPSGACRASCIKNGDAAELELGSLMMRPVTVQFDRGSSRQVASELARITARQVAFTPNNPQERFNLDAKNIPLWDVLETLSQSGKVQIGGEEFSNLQAARKALVSGERMSICIRNASVQSVVREFAGMSGLPIRVTSGDPSAVLTLSMKGVTLEEALTQVSSYTGIQISLR